jgi:hypothetical protein
LTQEGLIDDLLDRCRSQRRCSVELHVSKTHGEFRGGPTEVGTRQAGDTCLFEQALA